MALTKITYFMIESGGANKVPVYCESTNWDVG